MGFGLGGKMALGCIVIQPFPPLTAAAITSPRTSRPAHLFNQATVYNNDNNDNRYYITGVAKSSPPEVTPAEGFGGRGPSSACRRQHLNHLAGQNPLPFSRPNNRKSRTAAPPGGRHN